MTPPPVLATVSLLLLSQLLLAGSDTPACHTALVDSCSTDAAKAHSPFASEPCAVCAGKLQHKLRAAGCTHADIQAYCKNGENPFGPFPPTKRGGLDFNCTLASPLDVLFASPVGAVHCGTPVTGCPTAVVQTEPRVTLSTAEAASGYVVMMLDGQSSNRHWMLGNVPGTLLSAGFANENISGHPAAPHLSILSPPLGAALDHECVRSVHFQAAAGRPVVSTVRSRRQQQGPLPSRERQLRRAPRLGLQQLHRALPVGREGGQQFLPLPRLAAERG